MMNNILKIINKLQNNKQCVKKHWKLSEANFIYADHIYLSLATLVQFSSTNPAVKKIIEGYRYKFLSNANRLFYCRGGSKT